MPRTIPALLPLTVALCGLTAGASTAGAQISRPAASAAAGQSIRGHVHVPGKLHPGKRNKIRVSGYPPESRVRVSFGMYPPAASCCETPMLPRRGSIKLGPDGRRTLRVRMPRHFEACDTTSCPTPFRSGARVLVTVPNLAWLEGAAGDPAVGQTVATVR